MVDLKIIDYSEDLKSINLIGDIDTVKVMVWDDTTTMIPVTKVEKILSTDFK